MMESMELASPGASPPESPAPTPRPPPPPGPPPSAAIANSSARRSRPLGSSPYASKSDYVGRASPPALRSAADNVSRSLAAAVAAQVMPASSASPSRSPTSEVTRAPAGRLNPDPESEMNHAGNSALTDAQVRLSRARGRYQEHYSHMQRLLDTPKSYAQTSVAAAPPSTTARQTLPNATPGPSTVLLSPTNGGHPGQLPPQQEPTSSGGWSLASRHVSAVPRGQDEHLPPDHWAAAGASYSAAPHAHSQHFPPHPQQRPAPTPLGFYHTGVPEPFQHQVSHPLQAANPQLSRTEWSVDELKTMSSEVKDHVILRQQRQIQELTEQNQSIVSSAEQLLAEQNEIQERRLKNSRERDLMLARERDARDQRLSETIISLREELDKARYAEMNFERVCTELKNERRHLRFALGKLSRLQKKDEPLRNLLV